MALDWEGIFGLTVSPWEMVVRGTAMYWALFLLLRFVVRRRVGAVGMSDILLLVIVADAAQNAMAGEYRSVTDGLILVVTIIGWNMITDWLSYRFDAARKLRERGIADVAEVEKAYMESDGEVSVIRKPLDGNSFRT